MKDTLRCTTYKFMLFHVLSTNSSWKLFSPKQILHFMYNHLLIYLFYMIKKFTFTRSKSFRTLIFTGPNMTIDNLFAVTALSRLQSRIPFFKLINGTDPIKGSFLGPGGNFLRFQIQKRMEKIKTDSIRTLLIIICSFIFSWRWI